MKSFCKVAIFFLLPIALACNTEERVSREVFDQVKRASAVKRVSEVQIVEKALAMGEEISKEAQEKLMKTLSNAINEKGVAAAVEFCQVEALPILQAVGMEHNVEIRRASNRYRNPADRPNKEEEVLLSAYEYNQENDIQSEPNIQKIQNGEVLLYTRAITIPNQLCLNCHGTPDVDIDAEVMAKIDQLYPEDKAKGHQIGDLRGMWSIRIPKNEVIKRL